MKEFPSFLKIVRMRQYLLSQLISAIQAFYLIIKKHISRHISFDTEIIQLFYYDTKENSGLSIPDKTLMSFIRAFSEIKSKETAI